MFNFKIMIMKNLVNKVEELTKTEETMLVGGKGSITIEIKIVIKF